VNDKKPRKSRAGLLIAILLMVLEAAILYEGSPLYYKNIADSVTIIRDSEEKNPNVSASQNNSQNNAEIREAMENGGSITFQYNYIPSDRAWDTMYTYTIYRYSPSGDCTFFCERSSLLSGSETLCSCLYSETVWDEVLDLILDHGLLVNCKSVYDATGKVVSTPIAKTVSLANGVYSPNNIEQIESQFKRLAINAGANPTDLDDNIIINDDVIQDKTQITDLNGDFIFDPNGTLSEEDKQKLEDYLWKKYWETGVRMYIALHYSPDSEVVKQAIKIMESRATSQSISLGATSGDKTLVSNFRIDKNRESALREEYKQIYEAYREGNTAYEKVLNAIDKAYELY
jgi:hypothetical protein